MDAGSGFGFHRGGLGAILARFVDDMRREDKARRCGYEIELMSLCCRHERVSFGAYSRPKSRPGSGA